MNLINNFDLSHYTHHIFIHLSPITVKNTLTIRKGKLAKCYTTFCKLKHQILAQMYV